MKEAECPCIKADCERHGDCVAYRDNHADKPSPSYCKRPVAPKVKGLEARVAERLKAAGRK